MRAPSEPVKGGSADVEEFARNIARMIEEGGKALAAYLKPREEGRHDDQYAEVTDVVKTIGQVADYWLRDPQRALELQSSLGKAYLDLWANTVKRMAGEQVQPVVEPEPRDKRLPSNFVLTNPELLRETLASNAGNLVRGMHMLAEDIAAGRGDLKIRQSRSEMFEVGRNLALTPGKVIFENELMQLIQYAPTTPTVLKRPVLIVPPWINKFYILDLTPEKSFIKWCVDQGLTVFVISWVNPDSTLAQKSFEDYMRGGPLAALDVIERATGEREVNAIGYCVGGTLLVAALAYMASTRDQRIASATLFAAQVDFTHAGDLKVFVDEEQIAAREREMSERGYLEGKKMATAFNLLRSNDLIWPYVINNYLKGKEPAPFDLLYWNSDATRMPAANHSFYLRNCYLENRLSKGEMVIGGKKLDLKSVTVPIYNLATREDHIAPARSVLLGSKFFGGPVRFVLAGSGHIAGVVNPPDKMKYQYWTGPKPTSANLDRWLAKAKEHAGSWWPDWLEWIKARNSAEVPAREPGGGRLAPLEDAPGSYVRVRD